MPDLLTFSLDRMLDDYRSLVWPSNRELLKQGGERWALVEFGHVQRPALVQAAGGDFDPAAPVSLWGMPRWKLESGPLVASMLDEPPDTHRAFWWSNAFAKPPRQQVRLVDVAPSGRAARAIVLEPHRLLCSLDWTYNGRIVLSDLNMPHEALADAPGPAEGVDLLVDRLQLLKAQQLERSLLEPVALVPTAFDRFWAYAVASHGNDWGLRQCVDIVVDVA